MRGTLYDLGKGADGGQRWRLRVYLGPDPVTGKDRKLSRNVKGNRKEAEKVLNKLLAEADERRSVESNASVAHLLKEWIKACQSTGRSITTVHTYEGYIRNHILPAIGVTAIDKLTAKELDDLYSSMQKKGYASSSIHQVHSIMHRALRQAEKWGWVDRNVAGLATVPRSHVKPPTSPAVNVLAELLREASQRDPQIESVIAFAAVTGLRRGEIVALKFSDVDLDTGTLHVRRAFKTAGKSGSEIGDTKTHAERLLALDEIGLAVVSRQRLVSLALAEKTRLALPDDPWLFPSPDLQSPMHPDRITGAFRRIAVAIGKPEFHFHSLRHFSATEMIAAGVDVRTVAARLGHADASVTLRVYAHALPERDRAAAELLGSKITLSLPSAEG